MADYNIPTQMRGPDISVQLFPQAMATGIAAGNAQKTPTQAVAEGLTEGIKTGLSVYEKTQDITLKQQQIDMNPLEVQLKEQQLKNAETINQINEMKLRVDQATETQQLELARAEMKSKLDIIEGRKKVTDALASNDPAVQRSIFNDPQAHAAMGADSKLAEAAVGGLMDKTDALGNPLFSDEEKKAATGRVALMKKLEWQKEKETAEAKLKQKMVGNLDDIAAKMSEGAVGYIANANKVKPGNGQFWANDVQMFPSGVKSFEPDGTWKEAAPDRDQSKSMGSSGNFDVLVRQSDGTWKKQNVQLKDSEADTITKFQTAFKASPLYTPPEAQPPQPTAVDPAAPAPSAPRAALPFMQGADTNTALPRMGSQSSDAVTRQAYDDLIKKSLNNKKLEDRLVAEGLRRGSVREEAIRGQEIPFTPGVNGKPIRTPGQPPLKVEISKGPAISPREGMPMGNSPFGSPPQAQATPAATPPPSTPVAPAVIATKNDAINLIKALPKDTQKHLDPVILQNVETEPLLKGKTPLFKALVAVESGGKRDAKSPTGATGLAQLTQAAAKDVKVDRNNPASNVEGGEKYLNRMLEKYKGNEILALMAYNGGAGLMDKAIDHAIEMTGTTDWEAVGDAIAVLQAQGFYKSFLTPAKVREIVRYPAKVLAYKEAFNSLTNVG